MFSTDKNMTKEVPVAWCSYILSVKQPKINWQKGHENKMEIENQKKQKRKSWTRIELKGNWKIKSSSQSHDRIENTKKCVNQWTIKETEKFKWTKWTLFSRSKFSWSFR